MIRTILRVSWTNLLRDRVALALTFVLPVAFFSIFAAVFGRLYESGERRIRAAVVLEDQGDIAARFGEILVEDDTVEMVARGDGLDRPDGERLLTRGEVSAVIVVPEGFTEAWEMGPEDGVDVELLADTSHPMAVEVTRGALHGAALRLGHELFLEEEGADQPEGSQGPLRIALRDVLGSQQKRPAVAFFAAGLGVLFLLFAVSGRSAILIEERESGVLTRILSSRCSLMQLLLGRWLFLTLLGAGQVTLMFTWGALFFGLDLWTPRHLSGFAVMTAASAAAAAGFGLVLAAACRSRAQLNGVAAVVILVMSAVGGSMFPRFLMPEALRALGRLTFNAWALDGYQKVFWYEATIPELWPELAVLLGLTAAFLTAARAAASRWQHA